MTLPIEILPTHKSRVMDLVQEAGVDISDWSNYQNGKNKPASNPRYCYEWAFVEPEKLIVLNLWYDKMQQVNGGVELHLHFGESAMHFKKNSPIPARRKRMKDAIALAYQTNLPIRVIVLDRKPRAAVAGKKTTLAENRLLDPMPWSVTDFNKQTGEVVLRRGFSSVNFDDQFSLQSFPSDATGKREITATVYERKAEVRRAALVRAGGICEYCENKGFKLSNGNVYLETHHVIPLSEGGADCISNVAALCPNHHREAHYGESAGEIRHKLLKFLELH